MKKLDVLVIEDDPMVRKLICWELSNNPELSIHAYSNGEECYKEYNGEPDILVFDYHLTDYRGSGMNGIKFSSLFPKAYKVLVTGSESTKVAQNALNHGFEAMVKKDNAWLKDLRSVIGNISEDIRKPRIAKNRAKVALVRSKFAFGFLLAALSVIIAVSLFEMI